MKHKDLLTESSKIMHGMLEGLGKELSKYAETEDFGPWGGGKRTTVRVPPKAKAKLSPKAKAKLQKHKNRFDEFDNRSSSWASEHSSARRDEEKYDNRLKKHLARRGVKKKKGAKNPPQEPPKEGES